MCGFAIETTRREIGLDHLRLRRHVPTLDPLREAHLLVGRQQRHPADLTQVEPERVERRLDGQVEHRRRSRAALRNRRLLVRRLLVLLPLDQLDRAIEQVGVEVLDLLRLQDDVLKHGSDLVVGQKPLLTPIRDESCSASTSERCTPTTAQAIPCAVRFLGDHRHADGDTPAVLHPPSAAPAGARRPTGASPGESTSKHVESLALPVKKMKPKPFAPLNQSIRPFTASPPFRRAVAC
jgi:hypothetical protein